LAKFAYNNTIYALIQKMSFYSNYGYHSKFDLLNFSNNENFVIENFAARSLQLQTILKLHFKEAIDLHKAFANKF